MRSSDGTETSADRESDNVEIFARDEQRAHERHPGWSDERRRL